MHKKKKNKLKRKNSNKKNIVPKTKPEIDFQLSSDWGERNHQNNLR